MLKVKFLILTLISITISGCSSINEILKEQVGKYEIREKSAVVVMSSQLSFVSGNYYIEGYLYNSSNKTKGCEISYAILDEETMKSEIIRDVVILKGMETKKYNCKVASKSPYSSSFVGIREDDVSE